jgi:protein TonB
VPPPIAAEPTVDQSELRRGYIRGVSAAVAKHKRYPRIAMQRGWQGEVMLRVVVDGNGNLVDVAVQQGSGYDALDKEAMEMVRRAAPFPLTAGMRREELTISLPVQFRLEAP